MSYDIVVMRDCASNFGTYRVRGHVVHLYGESAPWCDCKGFQYRGKCRHLDEIYSKACLYNPQYCDGRKNPELRPESHDQGATMTEPCPACGGPTIPVRRAV